jgi:hypothetical protein
MTHYARVLVNDLFSSLNIELKNVSPATSAPVFRIIYCTYIITYVTMEISCQWAKNQHKQK